MSDLIVPFRPSNLELPPGMADTYVTGDLYRICERVAQVNQHLFVVPLHESRHPWKYAICEHCRDGVDRTVFDVKELDARVIEELGRIMAMPLHERLKKLEAEEWLWEASELEREKDELYEELGRPMLTQLAHDGFIDRPVSYPKAGVATRGRVRR